MSMSTHVVGIKPPDEKWKQMKAVWDACNKAGVPVPDEVDEFFEEGTPDDSGVLVDLEEDGCAQEWSEEGASGYEIRLADLPDEVKIIRFYNAW